jgi:hypothetical protein
MTKHKFTVELTEREYEVIEKYLSRKTAKKDNEVIADLLDKLYEKCNDYFMSIS